MSETVFPKGTQPFRLRCDFAEELGFMDKRRRPLSSSEAMRLVPAVLGQPYSPAQHEKLDDLRAREPGPRFHIYVGANPPGKTEVRCWIFDGVDWLTVPSEGLWDDMIGRLLDAQELPAGSRPPIYPTLQALPPAKGAVAANCVLHDSSRSWAGMVPTDWAWAFVEENKEARYARR